MTTPNNAARVAVEAAACPKFVTKKDKSINEGIFELQEKVWHLEAAGSALNALWQMTDLCAFHAGSNLDVPAQDMANLLKALHAEIARRTEDVNVIAKALHSAWKDKA